ncbi:MAG: hypothetical protein L3K14_03335 [Thermoplasmata archaeon]|nr:hypothetical protein [Thermoplasmata archaeon]
MLDPTNNTIYSSDSSSGAGSYLIDGPTHNRCATYLFGVYSLSPEIVSLTGTWYFNTTAARL